MDKISSFLKGLLTTQNVVTENRIFRLHYIFTFIFLLICAIVVLCHQFLGDPIHCMSESGIPQEILNSYCWTHSTFSVVGAFSKTVGKDVPYPGVDFNHRDQVKIYHEYYQWIGIILLVQALLFYLPHYIWTWFESKTINRLVLDLNCSVCDQGKRDTNRKILEDYFIGSTNKHVCYCMWYFICENLNVINVIGQICLVEALFSNRFLSYTAEVVEFTQSDWRTMDNPLLQTFPRQAMCTFHKSGPSGTVQKHDAICMLPVNAITEKIYLLLWFWFIILAILSCLTVAYRVVLYISSRLRAKVLIWRDSLAKEDAISTVLSVCNVGDWFVLDILSKNLNPVNFRDLVHDLAFRIEGKLSSGL